MLINKVTDGVVIQTFDTEKKRFVSQSFTAGNPVNYEDKDGNTLSDLKMASFGFGPVMGSKEPYLPFDMVQPSVKEN